MYPVCTLSQPNPTLNPTGRQRGALAPLVPSGAGGLVLALGRMPKTVAHLGIVALVSLAAAIPAAYAVCLDPKTLVSGYRVPLNEEIQSTKVIAIGTVTKEQPLHEDSSDPEGIAAYIYTVEILRQLKGRLPQVIDMRTENDSGRYSMEVGERHLLFLSKEGQYFIADSCGNSSVLPAGNATLKKVEATLAGRANAP